MATLILLPNLLFDEEENWRFHLPISVEEKVLSLKGLIAEDEKAGRRYLKRFSFPEGKSFRDISIRVLNEHTKKEELLDLLDPLLKGETWGLISDAGLPCLADPGSNLVYLARKKGILIEAMTGPSSLVLALMLSGLSAQKFTFHGYLEKESSRLSLAVKQLEKQPGMTHLFIEVPYRSQNVFQTLLEALSETTQLCVCVNLTAPDQRVWTFSIKEWRKRELPDLHKKPVVFVFAG